MKQLMNKYIISLFLLVCGNFALHAQHTAVTSVLSKCMEYYSSHPELAFEMNYKMYSSYSSSKLIHQLNGKFQSSGGKTLVQMGGQVQLLNDMYAVLTDEATKTIVVQERNKEVDSKRTPLGIDSLIGLFAETKVMKESAGIVTLSFNKPKAAFHTVNNFTVDIDQATGKVLAAVLYYAFDLNEFYDEYDTKTIPRIEIFYENYVEDQVGNSDLFSESRFFKINNQKLEPVQGYNDYRLIDLRIKK